MKFLDANVFIYAYYKPKVPLDPDQKGMKESSKKIISDIDDGAMEVLTSVVHLSEVANILKRSLSTSELAPMFETLYALDNVHIAGVTPEDYLTAVEMSEEFGLDPNDTLAVHLMQEKGISEIYSFDKDFEKIEGIKRIPPLFSSNDSEHG